MARTTKPTRAWATFGAYGRPGDDELDILALADEYREKLCAVNHAHHRAMIDYRNAAFPDLFAAMVRLENLKAAIWETEREVKQYHSDVRDRDAVTVEQESRLHDLRARRTEEAAIVAEKKKEWLEFLKRYRTVLNEQLDAAARKAIKTIDKRELVYDQLEWPDELREYAALQIAHDLSCRRLSVEYQQRGLHSAIRAEIVEASKPKLKADGPGTRYEYHRDPRPRPWRKITLQIPGGLSLDAAIGGRNKSLVLTPRYTNHNEGGHGEESVYEVDQAIGTSAIPRRIHYAVKIDKPFPPEAVIQRWSLVIDDRTGKRTVVPTIVADASSLSKPTGSGLLTYALRWSRAECGGVLVCQFRGDHVHEDLILPAWLVADRMAAKKTIADTDNAANEFLESSRGVSRSRRKGARHGTDALEDYVAANPSDLAAANHCSDLRARQRAATSRSQRAVRCIESIYETVTLRVCRLHSMIRAVKDLDLKKLKRYDTRDLLKGSMPEGVRELMSAVAPGKLRALLDGYGLMAASDEVVTPSQDDARDTDIFTSYVRSLGLKTGPKAQEPCRRSQHASQTEAST